MVISKILLDRVSLPHREQRVRVDDGVVVGRRLRFEEKNSNFGSLGRTSN
jgi:hypothetical protein